MTFIVLGLFLFSGASGLMYEVVWSRMFALLLGTTVYSISTVLGVFMGGLALGSWLFGKIADRPGMRCLRLYALLEICIGAFALALPFLMDLADVIYRAAWPSLSESFAGQMLVRFLLAVSILIVPSTLMGGTLPALSRFLVRSLERSGKEIGALYAVNTLGAFLGCFFTGFFLLEHLGIRGTLLLAAALNFVVGATAWLWSRSNAENAARPAEESATHGPAPMHYAKWKVRLALGLYAVCGFASLSVEVLWVRNLMYFVSADTWAFTAMLSAFLCGLGLGSLIAARLTTRIRNPLLALGLLQVGVGASIAAGIPLFDALYVSWHTVAASVSGSSLLVQKIVAKLSTSFVIMLVPTLLMGASFPIVSSLVVADRRKVGNGVGTLYALNTLGAIFGSTLAGFVLIPSLGVTRSILLIATLYGMIGVVMFAAAQTSVVRARISWSGCAGAALLLVGVNTIYDPEPIIYKSAFFKGDQPANELVFYNEGAAASISVVKNSIGTRLLKINGVTTAIANYRDMQVHRMLSHLPILLHPDPQKVLVVGFGMGSTAWGCCQHDVERVDVVELLRDEKRTAEIFEDLNHGVLDHSRLNFIEGDGRNYILATRERYDVISFNAIHPRYSANLYTKDFYELCRERLSERGVICAWMTQNALRDEEWRMLCRSFVDVFPHSSMWYCNPEHFCLIGTIQPTRIDFADWQRRMASEGVQADLRESNFDDPFVYATRYMFGEETMRRYVEGAMLNTDDRPLIEFAREVKFDERPIIERLIELKLGEGPHSAVELPADDAVRSRLDAFDAASILMMRGQVEHWYPNEDDLENAAILSEIHLRKALLLTPDNQDVRENLGFSERFKNVVLGRLRVDPNDSDSMFRLAKILREEGRLREAEKQTKRFLEGRSRLPQHAFEERALLHLLSGRPGACVAALSRLHRQRKLNVRMAYVLSVALERAGKVAAARRLRQRILGTSPAVAEWFQLLEKTSRLSQTSM